MVSAAWCASGSKGRQPFRANGQWCGSRKRVFATSHCCEIPDLECSRMSGRNRHDAGHGDHTPVEFSSEGMEAFPMRNSNAIFAALGIGVLAALASSATADNKHRPEVVRALLTGQGEAPVVSTKASGRFRAVIDEDSQLITYTLTYEGLEGGATLFAHIHLGERHTLGGVMVFLCGGGTKPDPCPGPGGEVTGSLTPADVLALATQQVPTGAAGFDELVAALRTPGVAYVNVHTAASPGGEIRGQVF